MKHQYLAIEPRRIFSFVIATAVILSLSSCSRKLTFTTSTITPAAIGYAKVKKDKNKNYRVNVSLQNLAPSGKLTPPRETYIVWVETESNGVKNIGQVNTSTGLLSKKLKASLETRLPFRPTEVFITAEDSQNVQQPGKTVVLTTK